MFYIQELLFILSLSSCITHSFYINSSVFNKQGIVVFASNTIKDGFLDSSLAPLEDGTELIQAQIEEMKKEAVMRLEDLSKQICDDELVTSEGERLSESSSSPSSSIHHNHSTILSNKGAIISKRSFESFQKDWDKRNKLEETSWKITLNIGREKGTWMPKSWGSSGDRLLLKLVIKFTGNELRDREDFLGGMEGAKILEILDNEATIGPTLQEGIKRLTTKSGGWRIIPKEGPAGTDLMRFYIEINEESQHLGSDVICPKGRIYCTCGYFPANSGRPSGRKETIREEQKILRMRYEHLKNEEKNDTNMFSLMKISRSKRKLKLLADNNTLNEHLKVARIQEPEKDLLRFSNDGSTALTREGGVCRRVVKGLSTEYHILGRFSIASHEKSKVTENLRNLRP